ncbi:hypothetical protein AB0D27_23360 [Streptomyces sp. NPDC048415]|jgi:hypothetical protein|uniref:hypothetical protein n=1 Tax=Streptomyces sp. NPDC048415 TaxID=3154822 RepID=UPI00343CD210
MREFGKTGRVIAATALLVGASIAVPAVASASPSANHPMNCGTDPFITVDSYGTPYYKPIGSTAGKYNASSSTSTLTYALQTTTSRSTSWTIGGSASVSWGIGKVEANFNHNVTKTTTKGITVTDTLSVKGKNYGYVTPKVEYRRFNIRKEHYGANCKVVVNQDYGVIDVIWTYPFFSECVAQHACTTKP